MLLKGLFNGNAATGEGARLSILMNPKLFLKKLFTSAKVTAQNRKFCHF